jgi:hypothetical protein
MQAVESLCRLCEKASDKLRPSLVQDKVVPVASKLATGKLSSIKLKRVTFSMRK